MRVVLDTNVIVSAFIAKGYSFDVVKDAVYKHELNYTDQVLKEIQEVLSAKFFLPGSLISSVTLLLQRYFVHGKNADVVEEVSRDPDDDRLLADTAANAIELLITGDKDLLAVGRYKGMRIVSLTDYWRV